MKTQTLTEIKEQLSKFHALVDKVATYWEDTFDHYTIISVLLQNAAFDSHIPVEDEEKKINTIIVILREFAQYYGKKDHFVNWVYNEVDMIISGAVMSEDDEEIQKQREQNAWIYSAEGNHT